MRPDTALAFSLQADPAASAFTAELQHYTGLPQRCASLYLTCTLVSSVATVAAILNLLLTRVRVQTSCTGDQSRNRTVGLRLGKGEKLEDIIKSTNTVAEGVLTSR